MGRLAKTGIAILGLASLGGFVSLLGGPSLFSPFSNAISTILPESEVAVEETEEKQKQDQIPAEPKPEERQELSAETTKEVEEEIAATKVKETSQTVATITQEKQPEPQAQSSIIAPPIKHVPTPRTVLKPQAKRVATSGSGVESYSVPSRTQGSGSDGSGI